MNTSGLRSGFLIRLGIFICFCVMVGLSACTPTYKVNYVNWEVQFSQGTSEQDKAMALDSVRRYILHDLSGQSDTGYVLKRIDFNNTIPGGRDRAPITVALIFGRATTQAAAPPKPRPGGPGFPKQPVIPNIQHIEHIANLGIAGY